MSGSLIPDSSGSGSPRDLLLQLYSAALEEVNGRKCVRECPQLGDIDINIPVWLVATGKAAIAMAEGALDQLGDQVQSGLVITKYDHASSRLPERFRVMEAAHPVPDEASLEAGQALVEYLQSVPENAVVLCLVSGGTSALVEVLPSSVSLAQLQQVNRELIGRGCTIDQINRIRKEISLIKQGRVLRHLQCRRLLALYLSDVPGDDPALIGSGLFFDESESQQAVDTNLRLECLPPDWLDDISRLPVTRPDYPVEHVIVGSLDRARQRVLKEARDRGFPVYLQPDIVQADYQHQAGEIVRALAQHDNIIYLAGGEVSVSLPADPGLGGRCQSLALAVALAIQQKPGYYFLAAGTDGTDGPVEETGALVDSRTVERGTLGDLDPRDCLQAANSHAFLESSGDLLMTGPTGTNVMDLYIGLRISD